MEIDELQEKLDIESLDFLNYILGNVFYVELEGCVYSEEEQNLLIEWAGFISCPLFNIILYGLL